MIRLYWIMDTRKGVEETGCGTIHSTILPDVWWDSGKSLQSSGVVASLREGLNPKLSE
jgi:hypothetical protein